MTAHTITTDQTDDIQTDDIVRVAGRSEVGIVDGFLPIAGRIIVTLVTVPSASTRLPAGCRRELHTTTLIVPAGDVTLHTRGDDRVPAITAKYRGTPEHRSAVIRLMAAYRTGV